MSDSGKQFAFGLVVLISTLLLPQQRTLAQETTGLQAAVALEKAIVSSIAKAERSVVAIARGKNILDLRDPDFIPTEFATGVVVDKSGLILTNYHVLGNLKAEKRPVYAVWLGRRAFQATVKAADPSLDLAVLEIKQDPKNGSSGEPFVPIKFGSTKGLRKGQLVIALGNPHAIARDGQVSATWGIISNLSRMAPPVPAVEPVPAFDRPKVRKPTIHHFGTLIQTDARLPRGTSGGALLNIKGEMIGLTTAMGALPGSAKEAGFAIPVDELFLRVIDKLKRGQIGEYGFLGVGPFDGLDTGVWSDGKPGVEIGLVVSGTPAAQARLTSQDLLTHIDDVALHTRDDLMLEVGRREVGKPVRLTYLRRGIQHQTSALLSKKQPPTSQKAIITSPPPSWRGLSVDYFTAVKGFNENARNVAPTGCVAIANIDESSPASSAGLKLNDYISHVNNKPVSTPDEFNKLVADLAGSVYLRISKPNGKGETLTVKAPVQ